MPRGVPSAPEPAAPIQIQNISDEEAHGRHEAARGSRGPRRCGGCVANDGGAQQSAKLPTIGYLGPNARSLDSQRLAAFVLRLRELGWIEDRTVTIEYRFAEGRNEHLAEFAADFVTRKVDVIVTSATPPTVTGKQVTSVIPIVFAALGDPVGARVVARPRFHGRNL